MEALDPMEPQDAPPFTSPAFILLLLVLAMFLGNLFSALLLYGLAEMNNTSLWDILSISTESTATQRNRVRNLQMLSHFFTFALPAVLVAWFTFRKQWPAAVGLSNRPNYFILLLGCLFIIAAFPPAQVLYEWNRALPLPDWMSDMEGQAEEMIRSLLIMESWDELVLNLVAIAIIPALGEELVFRGLVQRQIQRGSNNAHLAVWLSAALFSAIHLQFEGFLPRLFLGVALGYLLVWTQTLWVPILAHLLNNAGQVILQYFWNPLQDPNLTEQEESIPWHLGLFALVAMVGIGYILYSRRWPTANNPD